MFYDVPTDSIFDGPANFVGDALVTFGTTTVVVTLALCGIIMVIYYAVEGSKY